MESSFVFCYEGSGRHKNSCGICMHNYSAEQLCFHVLNMHLLNFAANELHVVQFLAQYLETIFITLCLHGIRQFAQH